MQNPILNYLISYSVVRMFMLCSSTVLSMIFLMVVLNIITVDELSKILNLSNEQTGILKLVTSRIQEVTENILQILTKLIRHLLSWAEINDIDLSKIKIENGKELITNPSENISIPDSK